MLKFFSQISAAFATISSTKKYARLIYLRFVLGPRDVFLPPPPNLPAANKLTIATILVNIDTRPSVGLSDIINVKPKTIAKTKTPKPITCPSRHFYICIQSFFFHSSSMARLLFAIGIFQYYFDINTYSCPIRFQRFPIAFLQKISIFRVDSTSQIANTRKSTYYWMLKIY